MNPFIGLDSTTLLALKTAYVSALLALAQNQGYSLNGRSLTRSNLSEVKTTLGQITAAIDWNDNDGVNETLISFTGL
tara:strand:- start:393 stop:623 length:231 start_codon:yes stop_codon:yes gene_type:complete